MEPNPVKNPKEEETMWEEQYPEGNPARSSADIILCDILLDALRQI